MGYRRVIGSAEETLYGDERLRSNLTDNEAQVLLSWALAYLTRIANAAKDEASARKAVQDNMPRVRKVVLAFNNAARQGGGLDSKNALVKVQPLVKQDRLLTRPELDKLIADLEKVRGAKESE